MEWVWFLFQYWLSWLSRIEDTSTAFQPDFSSCEPLEKGFGFTPRVAETLLWLAQGRTNGGIATLLDISESTVKKHVLEIFGVLGVETRPPACLMAMEKLGGGKG